MKEILEDMPTKDEIEIYLLNLFKGQRSCRGETKGWLIGNDIPCHDFFHSDVDGQALCIGEPIEEKFGLQDFNFKWGMSHHNFGKMLGETEKSFYEKYPIEELPTKKRTLKRFAEMIYDLIRIKNGLEIS